MQKGAGARWRARRRRRRRRRKGAVAASSGLPLSLSLSPSLSLSLTCQRLMMREARTTRMSLRRRSIRSSLNVEASMSASAAAVIAEHTSSNGMHVSTSMANQPFR
jgi:hypothetical protein